MSTFIHNEPTSLPILQEAKLPQSFLSTITEYTTVSTDVSQLSTYYLFLLLLLI
jgi:E3 ubiquitin-protein ligase HUWE1